ncbi:MAG: hypothetical protein AAB790_01825 [Patescibacteria group bacterium]
MHNHNGKGDNSMMWMMVLCCALPIAFLLFGGSLLASGGFLPKILFGAFAVACVWMMFKGHGGHGDSHENSKTGASGEPETKDTNKHKGCCQ